MEKEDDDQWLTISSGIYIPYIFNFLFLEYLDSILNEKQKEIERLKLKEKKLLKVKNILIFFFFTKNLIRKIIKL